MWKRVVCLAICGVIILGYVPISAAAEEAEGLCEYHISHDFDVCGFTVQSDEKPCNHVCDEGCITEVIRCAHEHSEEAGCRFVEAQAEQVCGHTCSVESCGYVMAAEGAECTLGCESVDENGKVIHGEGCGFAEAVKGLECGFVHEGCGCAAAVEAHWECDHVCSAESGCVTVETNCVHTAHDEACGYAAASDGTPCSFAVNGCEQCAQEDEDCTCDVKCAEGAVDAECAVCSEDFGDCTTGIPSGHHVGSGEPPCNDIQDTKCVCEGETACGEGAVNAACAVCSEDFGDCHVAALLAMTEKEEAALLASVQGMIDGLPSVEEVRGLTLEEQGAVYNTALVELWKVYDALTAERQGKLNTDRKAALEEYLPRW